mgnify:FL=1|jgi:hypothetical protein|tara:strand:+ start:392 stop:1528 length:1137 start_codon:yes stop_codon:yes gene_type:complete
MANRYPLIVDTTDGNKLKEIPSGDNLQLTGNSIVGVTDVTASGTVGAAILSATSIRKGGSEIATIAVTGAWTDVVGKPTALSQFTNDLNFLVPGNNISVLNNDSAFLTTVAFGDLTGKPTTIAGYGITDVASSGQGALASSAIQPGANISTLLNDSGFLVAADLANGAITVDVNNTGDLVGSVFADDSTVMIDSILAAINLDGTIRGNVTPNANQHDLWNLGTNTVRFKDAYFQGTVTATNFVGDGSGLTGISGGGDSVGNFTLASSVIDTDDSSGITITPAVTISSDLNVENDLRVTNIVYAETFESTATGAPTLTSASSINLSATDRVTINKSPLKFATFTSTERDALTSVAGDTLFNSTTTKLQVYTGSAWADLH